METIDPEIHWSREAVALSLAGIQGPGMKEGLPLLTLRFPGLLGASPSSPLEGNKSME